MGLLESNNIEFEVKQNIDIEFTKRINKKTKKNNPYQYF